jgi:acetylornithine deacetylase/succinyl-diaminopimelate desuccinylase-like protein
MPFLSSFLRWINAGGSRITTSNSTPSACIDAIVSDEHWPKVNCTHAINEGGIGLKDAIVEGQTVFAISVGERGVLWSRVIAEGPTGHGSTPIPGRAPEKLLTAMNRLNAWRDTPTIHPALYELLAEVGREAGGATGFIMERPLLVDAFVKDRLQQQPTTKAITNDTVHLTGFWGANSPNVVPSMVWAQYDVRLLPGTTPAAMEAELKALLADIPGVRLEVVESKEANESPWDDPLYESLRRNVVDGDARTVAGPIISPGFTDSIVLRRRGVRAYGVIPIVVSAAAASPPPVAARWTSGASSKRPPLLKRLTASALLSHIDHSKSSSWQVSCTVSG